MQQALGCLPYSCHGKTLKEVLINYANKPTITPARKALNLSKTCALIIYNKHYSF
jgi:hypothetical protein